MKYVIESPVLRCVFCEKILPTVSVDEKRLADKFAYEVPDLSKIVRIQDEFFHRTCATLPEFQGWLQCFLKRKGHF